MKPTANVNLNHTMQTLSHTITQNVTLYYREGGSDKVYQVGIEPAGDRFVVNFAYGRRGSTLNVGTKTNVPVEYSQAKAIFDQLVREKTAKGYTPGTAGTPYQDTQQEDRFTGILPQLLNPIDKAEAFALLRDPAWGMQQKHDGRRLLIQKEGEAITGINRKGLIVPLPETLAQSVRQIPASFLMDGESIGENLYAFDLLTLNTEDLRPLTYLQRWHSLGHLLRCSGRTHLHWVDLALTECCKKQTLNRLEAARAEGVVFKHLDARYTPGRPASGGDQLKYKFTSTLSAVVWSINARRSVEIRLSNNGSWQEAGNITIPPNHPVPPIGAVIDAQYLYAFPGSGILYQAVYLGIRNDIASTECTVTQLKYKPEEDDN